MFQVQPLQLGQSTDAVRECAELVVAQVKGLQLLQLADAFWQLGQLVIADFRTL